MKHYLKNQSKNIHAVKYFSEINKNKIQEDIEPLLNLKSKNMDIKKEALSSIFKIIKNEEDKHIEFLKKKDIKYPSKFDDINFLLPQDRIFNTCFQDNSINNYSKFIDNENISDDNKALIRQLERRSKLEGVKVIDSNNKNNKESNNSEYNYTWVKLNDIQEVPWYYPRVKIAAIVIITVSVYNIYTSDADLVSSKYLDYNKWKYKLI